MKVVVAVVLMTLGSTSFAESVIPTPVECSSARAVFRIKSDTGAIAPEEGTKAYVENEKKELIEVEFLGADLVARLAGGTVYEAQYCPIGESITDVVRDPNGPTVIGCNTQIITVLCEN